MILIHGKKRVPRALENSLASRCPHCFQDCPIVVAGCSEYFHLYGIPFFGWKSVVYHCSNCRRSLKDGRLGRYGKDLSVKVPAAARQLGEKIRSQVTIPWYYFAGPILVIAYVAYAVLPK
jgi:hypothetical protein